MEDITTDAKCTFDKCKLFLNGRGEIHLVQLRGENAEMSLIDVFEG